MARQRRAGQAVEDAAPNMERAAEAGMIAEPPAEGWDGPRAVRYTMPLKLSAPDNDLDDPDLPYWLALNRVRGIGPARFRALLDAFGTAEAAWCGTVAGWRAAGLDTRTASAFERQRHTIVLEAELERLDTLRVWALRITDSRYPRLLREIAMPPALLYVRGTLLPDDDWAVAIVGTRRATTYGRHVTDRLAGELARQRVTVVRGLARGIDTHAHTAALDAGGRTIAVLGCGPDLVYPPENARLAARIVETGAVVTMLVPITPSNGMLASISYLSWSGSLLRYTRTSSSTARKTSRFCSRVGSRSSRLATFARHCWTDKRCDRRASQAVC